MVRSSRERVTAALAGAGRGAHEAAPWRPAGPVGLLALQGSFGLHAEAFGRLGVATREVRKRGDLEGLAALAIPGGESTVMSLLLRKSGLFTTLQELGRAGMPMFGTCAGAILLGRGPGRPPRLEIVPVEIERNAYGRQVDSFTTSVELEPFADPFQAIFIRAPRIHLEESPREVEVLGRHGGDPVLVRFRHVLLATFHPELTEDLRVHRYFLEACCAPSAQRPRSLGQEAR